LVLEFGIVDIRFAKMKQRRRKRPRLESIPYKMVHHGGEADAQERPQLNEVARRPGFLPSCVPRFSRESLKEKNEEENMKGPSEEEAELLAPFCCAVCACSDQQKRKVETDRYHNFNWFQLDDLEGVWHRRCCHKQYKINSESFTLPFLRANTLTEQLMFSEKPEREKHNIPVLGALEWVTKDLIIKSYNTAKNQENELYNNDDLPTATQKLLTNKEYWNSIGHPYNKLKQNEMKYSPLKGSMENEGITVLDCFAGIGTAVLILKKLGVNIRTVIHVEHDKVATHVYRWNHDSTYNQQTEDDGINHVYLKSFEKIYHCNPDKQQQKFHKLWRKAENRPIDLVIGGPPCSDYSKVNAYRKGVEGRQGSYLVQFGIFIRSLEAAQKKKFGKDQIFFLAENVLLNGDDLKVVCEAFKISWDPIEFDAQYISPTRRRRHYFTNIPFDDQLNNCDYVWEGQDVESCLTPGFVLPSQIVEEGITVKANCLMASTSRIDERSSLRMYIFDKKCASNKRDYHGRPLTVAERENLMGYPKGYVEEPMNHLFGKLIEINHPYQSAKWRESLDKKYHKFAGNYHGVSDHDPYKYSLYQLPKEKSGSIEYCIKMRMTPPTQCKSASFYEEEEYGKHLIGNSFSVPVVEALLHSLIYYFPRMFKYKKFNYHYAWETSASINANAVKVKEEE